MNNLLFMRFISNMLNADIYDISKGDDTLLKFEKKCCFEKTLQPMYTVDSLIYLKSHMAESTVYEITDSVNTCLVLFCFKKSTYLVGPYVKTEFYAPHFQNLLIEEKLPAKLLLPLKIYYNKFPVLSFNMLYKTITAAMRTFAENTPDYKTRELKGFHEEIKQDNIVTKSNRTYSQIIENYDTEKKLLLKISEGDMTGVKQAFERTTNNFYIRADKSELNYYTANSSGFTILRTLARKAAEEGGGSVVRIDEITKEAIQKYESAKNIAEIETVQLDMLLALTNEVKNAKEARVYSPVIRAVLGYLIANYSGEISVNSLSQKYNVSPEYLSRLFKKEIGVAITEYISDLRLKKATDLLKSEKLSVSDISQYVGYTDQNYFARAFKKRYGVSPTLYRKENAEIIM